MATSGAQKLVIVESPTKARTIRKFLGKDYIVESCMGHVRDLPQSAKDIPEKYKKEDWAHLGVNVEKGFEPIYCVPKSKLKIVKALKEKLKGANELILATDEDREGESISWHLINILKPKVPVKRMVFHEITKEAIQKALDGFRDLDDKLVRAQEARRVLDRLVGYTISPLLWKKVAYGLSAGRVQSVAVRLISEKEHERIRFKRAEYWGLLGRLKKESIEFESKAISYQGKKIAIGKDFNASDGQLLDKKNQIVLLTGQQAKKLATKVKGADWLVESVEEKPVSRKPAAPFITSTLQQESNRKLGLSSRETMDVAQKLYERGFITYMRTDSTNLSDQAISAARKGIVKLYGKKYLPNSPRTYTKKKVKGAQEAHEAIRPAGTEFPLPEETSLSGSQFKLYDLIWKRTIASQMVNSEHKQVSVKFSVGEVGFSSSGMTIEFPGFLKAYVEGSDDPEKALDNREVHLPQLKVGEKVSCLNVKPTEHETKPLARYTEASLVQTLEKEGIGRPSTYAAIISTIQHRGYVKKSGNALIPTFTALVVSKLLSQNLPDYVDSEFTSGMEDALDVIAQGDLDWIKYLNSIYFGAKGLKNQVEVQEKEINNEDSRSIELDGLKNLSFRIGRYGAYVCRPEPDTEKGEVCASLPESQFPGSITVEIANKLIDQKINGTDALGKDPETDLPVYVLSGRYGPYVQLGDSDGGAEKPKRMSIPPTMEPEQVTLDQALNLLSLPKTLGHHPDTDKVVKVGLGRFGPYVVHDGDFRSIPKDKSIFELSFDGAMELLLQPKKVRGKSVALKELGEHPDAGDTMGVFNGKYGPYIKCGKTNVSLPDDQKPEDVTKEQAIELLAAKLTKKTKKKKAKKATAKKKVSKVKSKGAAVKKASSEKPKKKVIRRKA